MSQRTFDIQGFDDALERCLLMFQAVANDIACFGQKIADRPTPRYLQAKSQGVDEEAD